MRRVINVVEILGAREQGKTFQIKKIFMDRLINDVYTRPVFVGSGEISKEFTTELKQLKLKRSYWFVNPMTLKVYHIVNNYIDKIITIEEFLLYSATGAFTFFIDNLCLPFNKKFAERLGPFVFDNFYFSNSKANQKGGRELISNLICDHKKDKYPNTEFRYKIATVKAYPDQDWLEVKEYITKRFSGEIY